MDCTVGLGGHAELLLRGSPEVRLIAFDRDAEAIEMARRRLGMERVTFVKADYRRLRQVLADLAVSEGEVAGVLADLGVSSMQLESSERGFSFQRDGPLDMRMDRSFGPTAADLVNSLSDRELADILLRYGEERSCFKIARAICEARKRSPIKTTLELAKIVERTVGWRRGRNTHPATQTFQALRIAVNCELDRLQDFVSDAVQVLMPAGRLAVITFHSLEDRLIKGAFRYEAGICRCSNWLPSCVCGAKAKVTILTQKPIVPSQEELRLNPRARSAKLRVCQKI